MTCNYSTVVRWHRRAWFDDVCHRAPGLFRAAVELIALMTVVANAVCRHLANVTDGNRTDVFAVAIDDIYCRAVFVKILRYV